MRAKKMPLAGEHKGLKTTKSGRAFGCKCTEKLRLMQIISIVFGG